MKLFLRTLLFIFIVLIIVVFFNYTKLNIIAGYAAKNTASSVFLAERDLIFTDTTDTSFSPIHLATNTIDTEEKSATSSAFGLLSRKAIFREGLGSVLVTDDYDSSLKPLTPKRSIPDNNTAFPYGNANHKDTVFTTVDYNKLTKAVEQMFAPINETRAVLVVYKDKIIAEKYAPGFNEKSRLLGWSMTKSITGTLFGILQCQGKIDVNNNNLFDAWKSDARKNITLHNLLQMNSGLEWEEDYNTICDATKMLFLEKDMTKSQVNKPLVGKPNESWYYSSGTTNLLSGLLREQFDTHQEYLDFWYTDLIDKIGMNSMVVETDLSGNYIGSSYSWATARDWSKLGLLYLKNGNWNGEHLFDKDWVNYATTPTPDSDNSYGAQIWLNTGGEFPDVPKNMFSFNGYQGQYVFILPDEDLVIVRLGLTKNADLNAFLSTIVEAVK